MLFEKREEVGLTEETAFLANFVNRKIVFVDEQVLCVIEAAQLHKFVCGEPRKILEISVKL